MRKVWFSSSLRYLFKIRLCKLKKRALGRGVRLLTEQLLGICNQWQRGIYSFYRYIFFRYLVNILFRYMYRATILISYLNTINSYGPVFCKHLNILFKYNKQLRACILQTSQYLIHVFDILIYLTNFYFKISFRYISLNENLARSSINSWNFSFTYISSTDSIM